MQQFILDLRYLMHTAAPYAQGATLTLLGDIMQAGVKTYCGSAALNAREVLRVCGLLSMQRLHRQNS